jgi:hypothetical protein
MASFSKFAKAFASTLTVQEQKRIDGVTPQLAGQDDAHRIQYALSGVDIRRTDSVVNPVVGIVEMNEDDTITGSSKSDGTLVFLLGVTAHHTVTLSCQGQKWVPIQDVRKIENVQQYPESSSAAVRIGETQTNDGQWLLAAAAASQR